jgi:soluble lytic murein transglycosylase-like protein
MLFKKDDKILNKINYNKGKRKSVIQYILLALIGLFIGMLLPKCSHAATKSEILSWAKHVSSYYKIPQEIVPAIIAVESSFKQSALSDKGAVGLMQIMECAYNDWYWRNPKTRHLYPTYDHMKTSWRGNVAVGVWYLVKVCYKEKGNWKDAISSYFWGTSHPSPTYTYYNKVAMNIRRKK